MARLPQPGSDQGTWGTILNDFLSTSHDTDGSLKPDVVSSTTIADGAVTETHLDAAAQAKLNNVGTVADGSITEPKLATALQTKINGKADTSSLAPVATSGSYTDITGRPTSTDQIAEGTNNLYFTLTRAGNAAPVQSVAGKTGAVTVTSSDVGLGNVNNTSDANKPVSTAMQTALDARIVWVDVIDENTVRPAGATRVMWLGGTIQPVNMVTGDVWFSEVI